VQRILQRHGDILLEKKKNSGLTLLELMIVIAIISILASIAIPNYLDSINRSRYVAALSDLKQISTAIDNYYLVNGVYPANLGVVGMANIKDPWGNSYKYVRVASANIGQLRKDRFIHPVNTDYDLYSMGADGKTVTAFTAKVSQDDIVRANNGEYWGYVKDY
jgi:general secretion pathway protein G